MKVKDFLKKKLVEPLTGFLLQGISPSKLALAVALGACIAVFPVFGSTTLLCALAALALRLNMAAIQLVNYFTYPLQFMLFLPLVRLGEKLFNAQPMPFSITQIFDMFRKDILNSVVSLWSATWHAIIAWLITAPVAGLLIYLLLMPVFRKIILKNSAGNSAG